MPQPTIADIQASLAQLADPYLPPNWLSTLQLDFEGETLKFELKVGFPIQGWAAELSDKVRALLAPQIPANKIDIQLSTQIDTHVGQRGLKAQPNIKNIIAVASGKGGVGKSTTATNLALALSTAGARVGILDADIYGPSQPMMLGASQSPELKGKKTLLPIVRHGIQSMSIGYLIDQNAPMIWRGPMVSTALQQLLNDTQWDNLDYLIVDLPPGTGDIQLTLVQKIPVSAAVIVTTPQDLALLDARRAHEMFLKVNVPVLGIIENMSTHICSNCGHEEHLFGSGGASKMAEQYQIEFLGALPLDITIREQADSGTPTVVADPSGSNAKMYSHIARRLAAQLALQAKDYSNRFPNIVVKND